MSDSDSDSDSASSSSSSSSDSDSELYFSKDKLVNSQKAAEKKKKEELQKKKKQAKKQAKPMSDDSSSSSDSSDSDTPVKQTKDLKKQQTLPSKKEQEEEQKKKKKQQQKEKERETSTDVAPSKKPLPKRVVSLKLVDSKSNEAIPPVVAFFPNTPPHPKILKNSLAFKGSKRSREEEEEEDKERDEDGDVDAVEEGDHLEIACYRLRGQESSEMIVAAQSQRIEYVGSNLMDETHQSSNSQFMMGIYNKSTNKVRIVPIEAPIVIQQRLKDLSKITKTDVKQVSTYDMLQAHGTKSSKKNYNEMQTARSLKTKSDQWDTTRESAKREYETFLAVQGNIAKSLQASNRPDLPPFDPTATKKKNIYKIDDIITSDLWPELYTVAEEIGWLKMSATDLETFALEDKPFSPCILKRIPALATKTGEAKKRLASCLIFIQYLIRFYLNRRATRSKSTIYSATYDTPLFIANRFYRLFTTEKQSERGFQRVMGPVQISLLLHYIQITFLILNNFEFSINELAKDLELSQKELASSIKDIGCIFTMKQNEVHCHLTCPLKMPEGRFEAKSKRMRQQGAAELAAEEAAAANSSSSSSSSSSRH